MHDEYIIICIKLVTVLLDYLMGRRYIADAYETDSI